MGRNALINEPYYERVFRELENGRRRKWNWYAGFFGVFWYLYKGMWRKGAAYAVIIVVVTFLLNLIFPSLGAAAISVFWACFFASMGNWDYYLFKVHGENFIGRHTWTGGFPSDLPKRLI